MKHRNTLGAITEQYAIVIITSRRNHCVSAESFTFADGEIKPANRVRNLRAFFHCDINMRSHINWFVSSWYNQMNKINKTFDTNFRGHHIDEQFYHFQGGLLQQFTCRSTSLINWSHSDCSQQCSKASIWRFSAGSREICHAWFSAPQRIQVRITFLVYKAITILAPGYITSHCRSSSTNDRQSTLWSASKSILIEPKTRTETWKKSLSYAGPYQWNQLPLCVQQSPSVDIFKTRLKTF